MASDAANLKDVKDVRDGNVPNERWAQDFPIKTGEDGYTTRREFTKFLGLASVGFFLGTCWAAGRRFLKQRQPLPQAQLVAKENELRPGGFKLFRYPEGDKSEPCILIRMSDKYVAYTQSCTHLSCPVNYDAKRKELACPCHDASFSAEDGKVLAGPPKRALTRFDVENRNGDLWVKIQEEDA